MFAVRSVETLPAAVEAERSTEDELEVTIPPPAPLSEVVTQLMMFGSSLENLPKRKNSRRTTGATILSNQLGLF